MTNRWLLKTEPSDYSFADLEREGRTIWDGVGNNLALIHMRNVRRGDEALIYHTGGERSVVGIARVVSDPYADPALGDPKRAVFDVEVRRRLARPLSLDEIKADPAFSGFDLLKNSRLSAMPVPEPLYQRILALAGG
ncbi:MAG TPA: EVE domain-containing protein [Thermoanaerobaculia bacterium]|nr:EVE domain-containing protein [Thermoanaerobaculia bacterium]